MKSGLSNLYTLGTCHCFRDGIGDPKAYGYDSNDNAVFLAPILRLDFEER